MERNLELATIARDAVNALGTAAWKTYAAPQTEERSALYRAIEEAHGPLLRLAQALGSADLPGGANRAPEPQESEASA